MKDNEFKIDFFELGFLAEACIPPKPIARTVFWQNLTDVYWHQMTEHQQLRFFEWMQKNPFYADSLKSERDTQVFHARFDPENQYIVSIKFKNKIEKTRAFKLDGRYHTKRNTIIVPEHVAEVQKLDIPTNL